MLKIDKELAKYIRSKSPKTHINETCRHKSKARRKCHYVEETSIVKKLIKEYNEKLNIIKTYPPKK
jgi:hypothetical protein